MKRSILTLVLALGLAGASLGLSSNARAEAEVIDAPSSQLNLEVGQGRLIRLDRIPASIFLADPTIADIQVKSPTLVYITGKSAGLTTLLAVDDRDAPIINMNVAVHFSETQLRQDLKRLLPNSQVEVSSVNNTLVLSGVAGSAADALTAKTIAARYVPDPNHLINTMAVDAPSQINLRVRMLEVSRDIVKALGFNWGSTAAPGQFSFGLATGNATPSASPVSPLHTGGVDNLLAGFKSGSVDINVVIDALDSEGLITVLAEPNLTAESGAAASFLAGGEYPVPVPQSLGVTTIDYKNYGVSLGFVATLTDGGRINMRVKPEVSQLSNNGAITLGGVTVPALTVRRAETTVDLASGQSFAIAGLMQNSVTHGIQKFPGLGNIPGLGLLFRSDKFERNEDELVVIVTPYIVHPSKTRLSGPTDGYIAPTDAARVLEGADYTQQKPSPSAGVARPAAGVPHAGKVQP
jgi:pilus assembly protein CpaC